MSKPKLLLHVCCVVCFLMYEKLFDDFEITLFFSNSNIHPKEEYNKRLNEVKKLASERNIKIIIDDYNTSNWFNYVKEFEDGSENGKRCDLCINFRLKRTVDLAINNNYQYFSTTLNLSPYKNTFLLNQYSEKLTKNNNLNYISFDFDKNKRFELLNNSKKICQEKEIYRQKYCGCKFSIRK